MLREAAWRSTLFAAAWIALFAAAAGYLIRFSLLKMYSIDEFQYAHAAWLIAQGDMPYRDFFFHHFPLVPKAMSVVWLLLGDDPGNIRVLRMFMLPFVAGIGLALWALNGSRAAPLLLFATPVFSVFGTEIRPEPVSMALFLAALALLRAEGFPAGKRALLAGFIFVQSVWASEKAGILCFVLVAAGVVDLLVNRRRQGRLLGHPLGFLLGTMAGASTVALYLTVTGSWSAWIEWALQFSISHERGLGGFSWTVYSESFFRRSWWLLALAVPGIAQSVNGVRRAENPWSHPDLLPLGALPLAWVSFMIQSAPFPYSLIPFVCLLALFSGRGLAAAVTRLDRIPSGRPLAAISVVSVLVLGAHGILALEQDFKETNAHQHRTFARLEEFTRADDAVYDNSGSVVSRPHCHYYFFTNAWLRLDRGRQLAKEVPPAMLKSECVVVLVDARQGDLPPKLGTFLSENYQPYSGDLWLWGKRFEGAGSTFHAVRTARYFVEPAAMLDRGVLRIDGERVTTPIFDLERGDHAITYDGPPEAFHVLWLPRDGRRWKPRPGELPRFSRVFGLLD